MSIADKIIQLKKDFDDVYDKGVSDGKQAGYDEFWDAFQYNGERIDYTHAFNGWVAEYIRPKYKVIPKDGKVPQLSESGWTAKYYNMVYNCPFLKKIEKEYFDLSQYYNAASYDTQSTFGNYYTFSNNPKLEEIEDVGMQPYSYYSTFAICPKLHTIEVIRSNEKTWFSSTTFKYCLALQNIKIEGVIAKNISFYQSPNLSRESIESIINHLSDTTGETLTLSKEAVNNAFGSDTSDEWIETIADKVSSYNGVTYDGLWTIALV